MTGTTQTTIAPGEVEITDLVDRYLSGWNETDPLVRREIIEQAWEPGATLVDPPLDASGHEGVDTTVQALHAMYPDHRFERHGPVDHHHDAFRVEWVLRGPDGTVALTGSDYGITGPTGRIERVTGFFHSHQGGGGLGPDVVHPSAITTVFPTVCADSVTETASFYRDLLGFQEVFHVDWYVQLQAPGQPQVQLAVVARTHDSVPPGHRDAPAGVLIGIEVDDVDAVHERVVAAGHMVIRSLRDETWGQRHFIVLDPSGAMVDVITPIAPTTLEYQDAYDPASLPAANREV